MKKRHFPIGRINTLEYSIRCDGKCKGRLIRVEKEVSISVESALAGQENQCRDQVIGELKGMSKKMADAGMGWAAGNEVEKMLSSRDQNTAI